MNTLRFDALEVGTEIPLLTSESITRWTLAMYAGASGDDNPIHIDLDFAKRAGMPDVFAHGMLSMAYLGRALTNWVPQIALRSFDVRFAAIVHVGDRISCSGRVVEKLEAGGEKRVRLQLSAADQTGDVKISGEAVVALA
jgi:acyl dehydratase